LIMTGQAARSTLILKGSPASSGDPKKDKQDAGLPRR
jgi:hypothetical protein